MFQQFRDNFRLTRKLRKYSFIIIGLTPVAFWFYYFVIYPVYIAVIKSFSNWNLVYNTDKFIGIDNYRQMLEDSVFKISFFNSLFAVIYIVPATIVFALIVAVLLNSYSNNIREVFTPIYFLPVITSMVATSAVWKWLYHPAYGLFNYFLELMGLPIQQFLTSPEQALPAVSALAIWRNIGYFSVILLAALRGIPDTFYEAARIDGATKFNLFRFITIPLLKPTILFCSVMAVINAFRLFIPIQVMTRGGPGNSTMVLALYIFRKGVTYLEMGYASAVAIVLFLIIMIITVIQWKFLQSDWEY